MVLFRVMFRRAVVVDSFVIAVTCCLRLLAFVQHVSVCVCVWGGGGGGGGGRRAAGEAYGSIESFSL